jgi:flagellar motor switch/type III secretory pathway protein FliN
MALPNRDGRASPPVTPFPWRSLDSTTRAQMHAARSLRLWAAHHVHLDAIEATLGEFLDARVAIRTRRVQPLAETRPTGGAVAVAFSPADAKDTGGSGVVVEVESALAATMVARAIRRPPPVVVKQGSGPPVSVAGALAAILAAVSRRTHATGLLRVDAVGDAAVLESELLRIDPAALAVTLTVLVEDDAFIARASVSTNLVTSVPEPPWDLLALTGLGAMRLAVPVVACAARSTVAEIGILRSGDVFLPGAWSLAGFPGDLTGAVLLSAPTSEVGVRARLGGGARLVLGGELEPLLMSEAHMSETEDNKGAMLTAIGEIPVVVRVEIGEACMAARDWASLGRGDVVALGRRVGEHVVLRVGALAVARGELVEIEGEVGVRIIERLNGESAGS